MGIKKLKRWLRSIQQTPAMLDFYGETLKDRLQQLDLLLANAGSVVRDFDQRLLERLDLAEQKTARDIQYFVDRAERRITSSMLDIHDHIGDIKKTLHDRAKAKTND